MGNEYNEEGENRVRMLRNAKGPILSSAGVMVLLCQDYCHKVATNEVALKIFSLSQIWRPEGQNQGVSGTGLPAAAPGQDLFLALSGTL